MVKFQNQNGGAHVIKIVSLQCLMFAQYNMNGEKNEIPGLPCKILMCFREKTAKWINFKDYITSYFNFICGVVDF